MVRIVHIVWSPATGPIASYANPDLAWTHARTITGADVASMPVSTELQDSTRDDLERDFDGNDTPVEEPERGFDR